MYHLIAGAVVLWLGLHGVRPEPRLRHREEHEGGLQVKGGHEREAALGRLDFRLIIAKKEEFFV